MSRPRDRYDHRPMPGSTQNNRSGPGGDLYAYQGTGEMNIHNHRTARSGFGGRLLLTLVVVDAVFFFYGMLAYTGNSTSADAWRAWTFLVLLALTGATLRGWLRRRF
jgi:hypothetical protein